MSHHLTKVHKVIISYCVFTLIVVTCITVFLIKEERHTTKVLVIGDSFTELHPDLQTWTRILEQDPSLNLKATVTAVGGAGYRAYGRRPNPSQFRVQSTWVKHTNYDYVIVFGSVNDRWYPIVETTKECKETLKEIKEKYGKKSKVIVIGPQWAGTQPIPPSLFTLRDVVRRTANDTKLQFVDPLTWTELMGNTSVVENDDFHPNEAGHRLIATQVARLLGSSTSNFPV